jgi:hypothetical protein
MSRDGSGTFTLVAGNPVPYGTKPFASQLYNSTFADIKTEITDSLSRSGKGAMLAALKMGGFGLEGVGAGGATAVSATELGYINGATSAIQTQINLKAPLASPTFTGTVTIPTPFTLGAVSVTATGTELNFVDGVTSAIQTQLDAASSVPIITSAGETAALAGRGKCYSVTNGGMILPSAVFSAGDCFSVYNDDPDLCTITQGSGLTLRYAGTTLTGNRSLAGRGFCTIWFLDSSAAVISGQGLT